MPIEEIPLDKWQAVVATNLTGVFLCTQEAIKIMKAQNPRGGRIINNGSISAHTPRPGAAAYTATKHAVSGLTKQTALDCRGYDICCGQIDIGNAATPLTDRMVQGDGVLQPDGRKKIEARMAAEDVGRAVVYMASLPLDTNVLFMTVMANLMPFVGAGVSRSMSSMLGGLACEILWSPRHGLRCSAPLRRALGCCRRASIGASVLTPETAGATRTFMSPVVFHYANVLFLGPDRADPDADLRVLRPYHRRRRRGQPHLFDRHLVRVLRDSAPIWPTKLAYGAVPAALLHRGPGRLGPYP